jgi:hypothetical protein
VSGSENDITFQDKFGISPIDLTKIPPPSIKLLGTLADFVFKGVKDRLAVCCVLSSCLRSGTTISLI